MADVWITWCKRISKCKYCEDFIKVREPVVKCKFWMAGRWSYKISFHPQCYIEQGLARLREKPYEYMKRSTGRPKLAINQEDGRARYLLLRRRASIMQRRRWLAEMLPNETAMQRLIALDEKLDELKVEMELCGGVPKSW